MENLRGSPKEAVKEANPLELLDEDESDEVLSGSRDIETVRKVAVTAQQHRVVHELAPKKVYAPASKQKKVSHIFSFYVIIIDQRRLPSLKLASRASASLPMW